MWPLKDRSPLLPDAAGSFGAVRAFDRHTGVDLYCEIGTSVVAVESGVVVVVEWFTGQHVCTADGKPTTWWNDTQVVFVRGNSGVVAYGEISAHVSVGDVVEEGQILGVVSTAVLRAFKGRPMVMLHLELHTHIEPDPTAPLWAPSHTAWWGIEEPQPSHLLDPTQILGTDHAVFDLTTYDGIMYRDMQAPTKPSRWWACWGGTP